MNINLIRNFSISILLSASLCNLSFAAKKTDLTRAGDILQIANPIVAGMISTKEKGLGHFAIVYGQSMVINYASKFGGKSAKWSAGKRPFKQGKKDRFDGMPSGHTTSAWASAAYVRAFSEDHKLLSIPLYIGAGVTGYSRVKAKEHTSGQVFAAIALTEAVTLINKRMKWSDEYKSTQIGFSPDGFIARMKINF